MSPTSTEYVQPPSRRRRRLAAVVLACVGVALVTSSIANRQRITLRCVDGHLVAHRGRPLPFGEDPMDQTRYPPIQVDDASCQDHSFGSVRALERRYVDWTVSRVDQAMITSDPDALESAAGWMDRLLSKRADERLEERRRALLVELVERDLRQAEGALERARSRLDEARQAGADPKTVRHLQQRLDALRSTSKESEAGAPTPSQAPGPRPHIPATSAARNL